MSEELKPYTPQDPQHPPKVTILQDGVGPLDAESMRLFAGIFSELSNSYVLEAVKLICEAEVQYLTTQKASANAAAQGSNEASDAASPASPASSASPASPASSASLIYALPNISTIAAILDAPVSSISHALFMLESYGFLIKQRAYRSVIYRINRLQAQHLVEFLIRLCKLRELSNLIDKTPTKDFLKETINEAI